MTRTRKTLPRKAATSLATTLNALTFDDVAGVGSLRKTTVTLGNGKTGDLFFTAMSVRESRELQKLAKTLTDTDDDSTAGLDSMLEFLSSHLVNEDGTQFATSEQLEQVAIDDLVTISNAITASMTGETGEPKNDSPAMSN